jgi:hypothetical protein
MRKVLFLAAFMAVAAGYADRLYIVPVFATRVVGASGQSTALVHVLNPGPSVANVTILDIYANGGILDCPLAPDTQTLTPLESRDDIRPFCGANVVAAFTISSDRPLVITDDIQTAGSGHFEHQSVRVLTDWLPANRRVLVPNVTVVNGGSSRTNLFLVNPNSFQITVSVRLVPALPGPARAALDLIFDVPAKTTVVRPLPDNSIICPGPPQPGCSAPQDVLVQANGIFYAGASWLQDNDPVFRDPVLLDE